MGSSRNRVRVTVTASDHAPHFDIRLVPLFPKNTFCGIYVANLLWAVMGNGGNTQHIHDAETLQVLTCGNFLPCCLTQPYFAPSQNPAKNMGFHCALDRFDRRRIGRRESRISRSSAKNSPSGSSFCTLEVLPQGFPHLQDVWLIAKNRRSEPGEGRTDACKSKSPTICETSWWGYIELFTGAPLLPPILPLLLLLLSALSPLFLHVLCPPCLYLWPRFRILYSTDASRAESIHL